MLHSVVKTATVLLGLGVLGWTAQAAEAQVGYRHYSQPYSGYGGYYNGYGQGGYGGYGYGQSEEAHIYGLYRNVLGREPEPYEVLGWARNVRHLGLPPGQVEWMFRNSREYYMKNGYGGGNGAYGYTPYGGYGW